MNASSYGRSTRSCNSGPAGKLRPEDQVSPGGNWSAWSTGNWWNGPLAYELTVAQQNNGCVQLWAITLDGVLTSVAQLSPGGNWDNWS